MNNNEIKNANRKALPVFLLVMLAAAIVGGAVGFFSVKYGWSDISDVMKDAGVFFGTHIAPLLMVATAIVVPSVCVPLFRNAKKLLCDWDGEDENVSNEIERKLSVAIWITSTALIVSFFLIAATYSGGFSFSEGKENLSTLLIGIGAFLAILGETIAFQQKCVDAIKQMNPEKKASVYDMKFKEKWMEECDEAERLMIGKCAFKAYSVTNTVCVFLAVVLAVGALLFDIGFLPSLAVCLIWVINVAAYCKEALRCSKAGTKIS